MQLTSLSHFHSLTASSTIVVVGWLSARMGNPSSHRLLQMPTQRPRIKSTTAVNCCALWLVTMFVQLTPAADLSDAHQLFYQGEYEKCVEACAEPIASGVWNDGWSKLAIEAHFALGQYEQAKQVYQQVQSKFNNSLPLRMLGAQAFRYCGDSATASKLLDEIPDLVREASYRYSDRENRIAIGRYALAEGEDAREVLKAIYDPILKSDSRYVDAHLAIGELALEKNDFQEAAKSLAKAAELRPEDPRIEYLLARAWSGSDAEKTTLHLSRALELNPRHTDSLLFRARNAIDGERYDDALELIQKVHSINPKHPIAFALQAAIAHLRGEYESEGSLRKQALQTWDLNPEVDFTIGEILSRHYRFAEGVEYQRRAMQMEPKFVAARFQLGQDLLRLGQDDEGWELVKQVAQSDRYNVEAFNLRTLQERLNKFTTIESDDIWIRMDVVEAQVYGPRALRLLQEAKQVLEEKYQFPLRHRVIVEIFPQQSDFAIRTFGLPGGAGFLGVCFGNVITANSPASQGDSPSNWESVLWHEFCHAITLQKTNNRMPRWLSEGISVYEELQRNPSWGQRMNPVYQQMILGDDFVPLSQLSSAFLRPASPMHLQFAYFESSLAVRYLIEEHSADLLNRMLVDLGMGIPIQTALENRFGTAGALDADFLAFVTKLANEFQPQTDFSKPTVDDSAEIDWPAWREAHPNNYYAQQQLVIKHLEARDWPAAASAVDRLLELYPDDAEVGGAIELAAAVARSQKEKDRELELLARINALASDRVSALLRQLEILQSDNRWIEVVEVAQHLLAVQPLTTTGHQALVDAHRNLGSLAEAADSIRALQQLQPTDPAGLHYMLAESLLAANLLGEAKREVLQALEFSPRYREAQRLLVKIRERESNTTAKPNSADPPTESEQ